MIYLLVELFYRLHENNKTDNCDPIVWRVTPQIICPRKKLLKEFGTIVIRQAPDFIEDPSHIDKGRRPGLNGTKSPWLDSTSRRPPLSSLGPDPIVSLKPPE